MPAMIIFAAYKSPASTHPKGSGLLGLGCREKMCGREWGPVDGFPLVDSYDKCFR